MFSLLQLAISHFNVVTLHELLHAHLNVTNIAHTPFLKLKTGYVHYHVSHLLGAARNHISARLSR